MELKSCIKGKLIGTSFFNSKLGRFAIFHSQSLAINTATSKVEYSAQNIPNKFVIKP